ncbi:DoxX family protein [Roseibium algae]|uniref:DoxX family protein n=1 Tax=Roseibium algae TaxID=3123038 RepID=A0ABU8TJ79_9HYPH
MTMATETQAPSVSKGWNIGLWVAQVALAALYGMAVYMHILMSPADLASMGAVWAEGAPLWLVRFIGFAELAGVIGLILPAATRIMPKLTVYAAVGLLAIQALAIPFHLFRGEFAALPFNLIYVALAVLIIWGRSSKAPIAPRD